MGNGAQSKLKKEADKPTDASDIESIEQGKAEVSRLRSIIKEESDSISESKSGEPSRINANENDPHRAAASESENADPVKEAVNPAETIPSPEASNDNAEGSAHTHATPLQTQEEKGAPVTNGDVSASIGNDSAEVPSDSKVLDNLEAPSGTNKIAEEEANPNVQITENETNKLDECTIKSEKTEESVAKLDKNANTPDEETSKPDEVNPKPNEETTKLDGDDSKPEEESKLSEEVLKTEGGVLPTEEIQKNTVNPTISSIEVDCETTATNVSAA